MTFSAMISDLVMDATLQAHYEVQKLNVLCDICHTRYVYLNDVVSTVQYLKLSFRSLKLWHR